LIRHWKERKKSRLSMMNSVSWRRSIMPRLASLMDCRRIKRTAMVKFRH